MWFYMLVVVTLILCYQMPQLKKTKSRKDVFVFLFFLSSAVALWIVLTYNLPFPNPTEGIEFIFKPATDAFFGKS